MQLSGYLLCKTHTQVVFPARHFTPRALYDVSNSLRSSQLADEYTFIVNFLMPWGNLVSYYKIPEKVEGAVGRVWEKVS